MLCFLLIQLMFYLLIIVFHGTYIHQTIPAIEFETESVAPVTDIQRRCLLACLLAAHAVGIADAMVAGHEMIGDGVGFGVDNRGRDVARRVSTLLKFIAV